MDFKNIIESLGTLTDSLKNIFANNHDNRLDNIKKAMSAFGYRYSETADCVSSELAADRDLRYKSQFLLRLKTNQTIYLGYTIYGKRCGSGPVLQKAESKERLKNYSYQSGVDSLVLSTTLSGGRVSKNGIYNAMKEIRTTALAIYQDAGIPEDPKNAMSINGIMVKNIENILKSTEVFDHISVNEDCVCAECKVFTNGEQAWKDSVYKDIDRELWSTGISITPSGSHDVKITAYFHVLVLPIEQAENLGKKFFLSFKIEGTARCTQTELSYAITFDAKKGEETLKDLIYYMLPRLKDMITDVNKAVVDEYKRIAQECVQKCELEKQEREKQKRQNGLGNVFAISLKSDMTVGRVRDIFSAEYPNLHLGFFLVQTAEKANKTGESITQISHDSTLRQIRSFRGDAIIALAGKSTPEEVEKAFRSKSGLVVKVCYDNYYISPDSSYYKMPLYDVNLAVE